MRRHRQILTEWRIVAVGLAFATVAALYVTLQVIW
jgi:hypothetical protein